MDFFVGKGAGRKIMGFLERARKEVIVISPWIGKNEAEKIKELVKSINVKVFTRRENNPGLEVLSREGIRWEALLWILGVVAVSIYLSMSDPRFLLLLILAVPALFFLKKQKVLPWVKLLDDLHAKIYIADDVVILSSANLTRSGTSRNIEFLIVLRGKESEVVRREILKAVKGW